MIDLQPAPATLPQGQRIYAIGDIHGCARQLINLHALIAADLLARPVASPLLLHIGDYVDRGADTAGVIAHLLNGPPIPGLGMVNLMGNHESTMLEAIGGERAAGTDWLFAGGKAALQSYGIDPEGPRDQWATQIPQTHQAFLRGLILMHRQGG
jgi:serine/threonine protein phosphatase 1